MTMYRRQLHPQTDATRLATGTDFSHWMTSTNDVTETPALETLLELLEDRYAREILRVTSQTPLTVKEISDEFDASPSTLYGRVDRLLEADLLVEQTRIRSDGHHDTVYAATLTDVHLTLADGSFEYRIERADEDAVDKLQRLWREF